MEKRAQLMRQTARARAINLRKDNLSASPECLFPAEACGFCTCTQRVSLAVSHISRIRVARVQQSVSLNHALRYRCDSMPLTLCTTRNNPVILVLLRRDP